MSDLDNRVVTWSINNMNLIESGNLTVISQSIKATFGNEAEAVLKIILSYFTL